MSNDKINNSDDGSQSTGDTIVTAFGSYQRSHQSSEEYLKYERARVERVHKLKSNFLKGPVFFEKYMLWVLGIGSFFLMLYAVDESSSSGRASIYWEDFFSIIYYYLPFGMFLFFIWLMRLITKIVDTSCKFKTQSAFALWAIITFGLIAFYLYQGHPENVREISNLAVLFFLSTYSFAFYLWLGWRAKNA